MVSKRTKCGSCLAGNPDTQGNRGRQMTGSLRAIADTYPEANLDSTTRHCLNKTDTGLSRYLSQESLFKHEALSSTPRNHTKSWVHLYPSTGEVESSRCLGLTG